jgi:hypothetical protein
MSRLIDDRGRLFGKISLIDLLVLLLIVAVGVFAYGRVRGTAYTQTGILTTLTIEKVKDPTVYVINKGDVVHDDAGSLIGTVVEQPAVVRTPLEFGDLQGNAHESPSQVYWDINVKIKGQGQVSKSVYRIGGTRLSVGKPLTMLGPRYEVKTTITGVESIPAK